MRCCHIRMSLFVALAVAVGLGIAGFLRDDTRASALEEGRAYKPVVGLDIVMPKVDDVYSELEDLLTSNKFVTLRKDTAFLAEMMNLAGHYDHSEYSKEKGWEEMATKTRDLLLEASATAKKKEGPALKGLLEKIDASCEVCHEKYRDI